MTSSKSNIVDQVSQYDEDFIASISLKDIKNNKELKDLISKVEIANETITSFYQMMYNDYIMSINNDYTVSNTLEDIELIKKYKSRAGKLQKLYNYLLYIFTFENPFKVVK